MSLKLVLSGGFLAFTYSVYLVHAISAPLYDVKDDEHLLRRVHDTLTYLHHHNRLRAQHGAESLTWNDDLANAAQYWANQCGFRHSNGLMGPLGGELSIHYQRRHSPILILTCLREPCRWGRP